MPIYEFICTNCDFEFEDIVRFNQIEYIKCPQCDGQTKRKISRSSFHLKGSGWSKPTYSEIDDTNQEKTGCVRIPEYKDRNTGAIGLGPPEMATDD